MYGEAVKKAGITSVFEKMFQHAHVERFSKTSWAGKEIYLCPVIQKFTDESCFINIIESFCADFLKIFNANRQFYIFFQCKHSPFRVSPFLQKDNCSPDLSIDAAAKTTNFHVYILLCKVGFIKLKSKSCGRIFCNLAANSIDYHCLTW